MLEIKKTKSLSPVSGRVIDARIVLDDGKIYLIKKDEKGKTYKTLVEHDCEFYQMMTAETVNEQVEASTVYFYVSAGCNLDCPVCFESGQHHQELSLAEMEALSTQIKNKSIALMGKEPTCRQEIFELIRLVNRNNRSALLTNGIKLADYDYVARLKEAGLSVVVLAFHGFDDKIYEALNGRPLLGIKLKVLENLKKAGIRTVLNTTIARGVNEDQIKKLTDFCFENRCFISQLRIRTAQKIGAHLDVEPFTMSGLINMLADALDIPKEDILKEHIFWTGFIKEMGPFTPPLVRAFLRPRLCAFSVTVMRGKNGYSCLGSHVDIEALKKAKFKKVRYIYNFFKIAGLRYIVEYLSILMGTPFKLGDSDRLMVSFRCWPNIYNIDLQENYKCPSRYYKNGEFVPFCYSNIMETLITTERGTS